MTAPEYYRIGNRVFDLDAVEIVSYSEATASSPERIILYFRCGREQSFDYDDAKGVWSLYKNRADLSQKARDHRASPWSPPVA